MDEESGKDGWSRDEGREWKEGWSRDEGESEKDGWRKRVERWDGAGMKVESVKK
jgi:hypothetical protein